MDSPEERLLRLIRRKQPKKNDGTSPIAVPKENRPSFVKQIKGLFVKGKLYSPSALTIANKILITVLAVTALYFVYSLFSPSYRKANFINEGINMPPSGEAASPGAGAKEAVSAQKPEDYSAYESQIKGKQLFGALSGQRSGPDQPAGVDASKKFNLVGIIAGDRPQAIIEDKETQKTYYLYAGQSFDDATVEEVDSGKVVLNYRGERITLVL